MVIEWMFSAVILNSLLFGIGHSCPDSCLCIGEFVRCEHINENTTFPLETETIVIESAEIEELTLDLFKGLKSFQLIEIRDCQILSINTGAFSSLENLESVFISNTIIEVIQTNAFHNLSNMNTLDIRECNIKDIQSQAFDQLSKISRFELALNHIEKISTSAFHNIVDISLFEFYLNVIEEFQKGAMSSVYSETAKFYMNTIRNIGCNTVEKLLIHSEKSQFYSNNFRCDCGILWMKNENRLSKHLSNNVCLNRKFLDEFFNSSKISSCTQSLPNDCNGSDFSTSKLPQKTTVRMSTKMRPGTVKTYSLTETTSQPEMRKTTTKSPISSLRTPVERERSTPTEIQTDEPTMSPQTTTFKPRKSTRLPKVSRKIMTQKPDVKHDNANRSYRHTLDMIFLISVLAITTLYF